MKVRTVVLNEKIQLVEHNSEWKQQYLDEVNSLKQKSCLSTLEYEHIGSTSIPNIKAKPIVDIIIGVRDFPPQKEIIEALKESGYTYMQEMSVPDRLYFIKRGLKSFNVHIIKIQGSVWNNDVLFRDYMINHPEEARKYSDLKEEILRSGVDDLLEYSKRKADFILRIYEKM